MPLPVVIDVGVVDPPRELTSVLVEACNRAAAETECHLMREAPEGPYAAIAIITWDAEDRVRIEVGLRRETGAEWRSREIAFQKADLDTERYRSVGFVIGTLATSTVDPESGETEPAPPEPEPPPPAPPPPLVAPKPTPKPPRAPTRSRGFVGLSGGVGAGLDQGAPRFGGNLRAGFRVIPRLSLLVSAGASLRPRDDQGLLLSWLDAGLGVGYSLGAPSATHLELRLEFLAEHFSADAETARARTLVAARPGLDGVIMVSELVGITAGVEGTLRSSVTHLSVNDVDAGQTLRFEPGAALGVRLEF
jgi:hypothetical protein